MSMPRDVKVLPDRLAFTFTCLNCGEAPDVVVDISIPVVRVDPPDALTVTELMLGEESWM